MRVKFLHIPKTGGTALKNYLKDHHEIKDKIYVHESHNKTLKASGSGTGFVIRDPLERFCSGFWGRKNYELRQEAGRLTENKAYHIGGMPFTELEQHIFSSAATPNDFISLLKDNTDFREEFEKTATPLNLVTQSLAYWLGGPAKYKVLESNVVLVMDITNMSAVLKRIFDIDLEEQNNFKKRSKQLFDFEQSYDVSFPNREWFTNHFRPADYELISYIKSRNYYITR